MTTEDAAITLPLKMVEDLLMAATMAEKVYARGVLPWESIDDARKEVAQVKVLLSNQNV